MKKDNNAEKLCQLCKESATNICYDCSYYLCDSCFKYLHEKKANSGHKKEEICPFISIEINCSEHPKIPKSLFCLEEKSKNIYIYLIFIIIVLLCSLCQYKYKHDENHHLIDISDKESLEENEISYKQTVREFDEILKKTKNLKQNIEKEIEKINKSHEVMLAKIKSVFEEKHLRLNEEEHKMESDLDLKITQIKDDLEKYLRESNDILLYFERISKSLINYEKKNNNNETKALCYISEIQKVNGKARDLLKKPIKNIDIKFNNSLFNNDYIDYKDYYFSGIPLPTNIKVGKKDGRIYIMWEIGDIRIKDFNKKKFKYSILIEGNNRKIQHESNENSLLLNKNELKNNIDYEVKICSCLDGIYSDYSEMRKFKLNELQEIQNSLFENIFG